MGCNAHLIFFLWEFVKDHVYRTPVCDLTDLQEKIHVAFNNVCMHMSHHGLPHSCKCSVLCLNSMTGYVDMLLKGLNSMTGYVDMLLKGLNVQTMLSTHSRAYGGEKKIPNFSLLVAIS